MKTTFVYKLIGTPPAGLIPGEYCCEFIKMETKKNTKGKLKTTILLELIKEKQNE